MRACVRVCVCVCVRAHTHAIRFAPRGRKGNKCVCVCVCLCVCVYSTTLHTSSKLKICKSSLRSVLLYAAETWITNRILESGLIGFESRCLRKILRIWWEQRVTDRKVWKQADSNYIVKEVKKRRWKWLGQVLRMKKDRHPYAALTWAPLGNMGKSSPLGTWRGSREELG